MRFRFFLLPLLVLVAGCATRPLPPYERPLAHTELQTVRTTAYTDTESDHLKYGASNALGTSLQHGAVNSAAADWSRWPAGTQFRILPAASTANATPIAPAPMAQNAHGGWLQPFLAPTDLGPVYLVDDYGWALAGTNTIDIYQPTTAAMRTWGVRRVRIQILHWGDPWESYRKLKPRAGYRHVKRMLREIEQRY